MGVLAVTTISGSTVEHHVSGTVVNTIHAASVIYHHRPVKEITVIVQFFQQGDGGRGLVTHPKVTQLIVLGGELEPS